MLKAAGWQFIHKENEIWFKKPDGEFFHRGGGRSFILMSAWRRQFGTNIDKVNFDE